MPLPSWLETGAEEVGSVIGLPFNILGAIGRGALGQQGAGNATGWNHPDRYALALSYIPDALSDEDRAQRLETFRLVPINSWPALIRQFQKTDLDSAKVWSSPEAQRTYDAGGPQAWAQRYPGVPLPPSRPITIKDYPPMDALDEAIAKVGGTENVPLPLPLQGRGGPMFPPVAMKDAVDDAKVQKQYNAFANGNEDDMRAIAGLPPTVAYEVGRQSALNQVQQGGPYRRLGGGAPAPLPHVGAAPAGEPVGGYLGPQRRPDGGVSTELLIGIQDDRINGGKETNIPLLVPGQTGIDRLLAGARPNDNQVGHAIEFAAEQAAQGASFPAFDSPEAATEAARTRSANGGALSESLTTRPLPGEPMRGRPSLSLENYPGATAADLDLMKEQLGAQARADIELDLARRKADLAKRQLSDGERAMLSGMIPAEAMLSILERYAEEGGPGITPTLPTERVRGSARIKENLRQNEVYQDWWDADPFLQGFKRLHVMGRPILARGIGDDKGNLAQPEQQVWDAVLRARSVPEVKDAVQQVRSLIDEKKRRILDGKDVGPSSGTATSPTGISREEALAEAKRRGLVR